MVPFVDLAPDFIITVAAGPLSFSLLLIAFLFFSPSYSSPKASAWIITTIASGTMTAASIPLLWAYITPGGSIHTIPLVPVFAATVGRAFQGYLLADLLAGYIYYRSQLSPVTGWGHHIAYVFIVELALHNGWAHIFCLCLCMELPTFILGTMTLHPRFRSNILFAFTFFATRITLHLVWLVSLFKNPYMGSRVPAILLTSVFPLHAMWFANCLKGFMKRRNARRNSDAAALEQTQVRVRVAKELSLAEAKLSATIGKQSFPHAVVVHLDEGPPPSEDLGLVDPDLTISCPTLPPRRTRHAFSSHSRSSSSSSWSSVSHSRSPSSIPPTVLSSSCPSLSSSPRTSSKALPSRSPPRSSCSSSPSSSPSLPPTTSYSHPQTEPIATVAHRPSMPIRRPSKRDIIRTELQRKLEQVNNINLTNFYNYYPRAEKARRAVSRIHEKLPRRETVYGYVGFGTGMQMQMPGFGYYEGGEPEVDVSTMRRRGGRLGTLDVTEGLGESYLVGMPGGFGVLPQIAVC